MSKRLYAAAVLAFGGLAAAGLTPAFAQHYNAPRKPAPPDPAYNGVPNIPDQQGCVKWCFRDNGPCDPPEFKRADGRCAFPD